MRDKLFSIIIPVFNRRDELRRCLLSLKRQSYPSFEVLVVDDASTVSIADVLDELNDEKRFRYYRNSKNGGPYNARTLGWRNCRGDFIINIDSDWEAFPWMLERARYFLDAYPEAASIAGMHMRNEDSRMFVRVRGGKRLVTPEDAAGMDPVPDCVGATRRFVVDEWLTKSHDYFALEGHAWLTFSLKYSQLYIDEPWVLYYTGAANRASARVSGRSSERVRDCLLSMDDHDVILKHVMRKDVDLMLENLMLTFLRNRHWVGFGRAFQYLKFRSRNPRKDLVRIILKGARQKARNLFLDKMRAQESFWV